MTVPELEDAIHRACEGCLAEPLEPCRPGCLGHPDAVDVCAHPGCEADMTSEMCPWSHRHSCLDHCGHEDH